MNRNSLTRNALLGGALLASVAGGEAFAACGGSVLFGQGGDAGTGYSYVVSPGGNDISSTLVGDWWALGNGDPNRGAGNDAGAQTADQWLRPYNGTFYMGGDWIQPGTDGCISELGFPSMVSAFSDQSNDGLTGYFAVAGVDSTHGNFLLNYDFSFVNGGAPQDISLVPIPSPVVLSVAQDTATNTIDLAWDRSQVLAGVYSDPGTDGSGLVTGYRVYWMNATADPTTRVASMWNEAIDLDGRVANGAAQIQTTPPAAGEETFVALRIDFESGFSTTYVGASTRVDRMVTTVSGSCPGPITITVDNATPGGLVALLRAPSSAPTVLSFGPCAGTPIGVVGSQLLITTNANGSGTATVSGNAPAILCGQFVQAIDAATCGSSTVDSIQ